MKVEIYKSSRRIQIEFTAVQNIQRWCNYNPSYKIINFEYKVSMVGKSDLENQNVAKYAQLIMSYFHYHLFFFWGRSLAPGLT